MLWRFEGGSNHGRAPILISKRELNMVWGYHYVILYALIGLQPVTHRMLATAEGRNVPNVFRRASHCHLWDIFIHLRGAIVRNLLGCLTWFVMRFINRFIWFLRSILCNLMYVASSEIWEYFIINESFWVFSNRQLQFLRLRIF